MMLQQSQPDDGILAAGQVIGVHDFTLPALEEAGRPSCFIGDGSAERGVCKASGETLAIDPRYFRLMEVDLLIGDATKAREQLGWHHTTQVRDLVREIVRADLILLARGSLPGSVPPVPVD